MAKKYYEITVNESYTRTFRVYALDEEQAQMILEDAFNNEDATCDEGDYDYCREMTEFVPVNKNEFINTRKSDGFFSLAEDEDIED